MISQPPLNPDALEAAYIAVSDESWLAATAALEVAKAAVSAYLAAALPEVTSVEKLETLPVESVVLDADNCVLQILHNGERYLNGDPFREYCMVGDIRGYESDEVALPARVLHMPEVKP